MNDLNSAAQVSTFLKTGYTFNADLLLLTIFSLYPVNFDNFLSENPIDLILLNSSYVFGSPLIFNFFSSLIRSFI